MSDPQPVGGGRGRRPLIGPFTGRQIIALVASAIAVAVLLAVLTTPLTPGPTATPPQAGATFVPVGEPVEGLRIGDVAPELMGDLNGVEITLHDLDGEPVRLADLRGQVVWINFWATWCPPCQEETPVLRDTYERYRDEGLSLVAVSVQETTVEDVRAYVELYDLHYTVGFDATSAVFHTYRGYGLPTQIFLDRQGIIRQVVLGPVTRTQVQRILEPLLAEDEARLAPPERFELPTQALGRPRSIH
jgi:cytochrome c biogenesis protein CcmG, thiol:disulfide interchange protein DsbE